ncbi:MAG: transglutaminase domain-containing protein [Pseudomonadales bacterium]|jgi:hypothetical protein|nr:transglutaminase domain-containing protein [Pseudomonadales bacterium]
MVSKGLSCAAGGRPAKGPHSSQTPRRLATPPGPARRPHPAPRQLLALLLGIGLLAGCERTPSTLARFDAAPADRFYAIELGGRLAGRMHEALLRDAEGRPTIRVVTLVDLPGGGRLVRRETRRFARTPPHALEHTELWQRGPDGRVDVSRTPASEPAPRLAASLEPDAPAPQALADGTPVELLRDADGAPREYRIGRGFVLRRSERLPQLPALQRARPLRLPVDASRRMREHITGLTLEVEGPAASLLVPGSDGAARLDLEAPPAPEAALAATLDAMLTVIGERLRYVPGASPPDLDALLARGEGDCHEFALLFDALAERAGLDAEIVTGLAWSPADPRAFVPHAWNRVRDGDAWVVVDPTWGRVVLDADRVPFPAGAGAQLDLQLALAESRLAVVGAR